MVSVEETEPAEPQTFPPTSVFDRTNAITKVINKERPNLEWDFQHVHMSIMVRHPQTFCLK